jgi:hypothetical protein
VATNDPATAHFTAIKTWETQELHTNLLVYIFLFLKVAIVLEISDNTSIHAEVMPGLPCAWSENYDTP